MDETKKIEQPGAEEFINALSKAHELTQKMGASSCKEFYINGKYYDLDKLTKDQKCELATLFNVGETNDKNI